jgi:hypothetical protein
MLDKKIGFEGSRGRGVESFYHLHYENLESGGR